ncbi:MAG: hypothetical protein M0P12_01170 [Paludibacteraceae bacterium]|nr:hypothetical protein [Paludibacteraceae bacterium]
MRNLASIQKISRLEEIPEAKNVIKAFVLGWEIVVKKNEFKPGDLCVFFETDSLLPKDNTVFSFMESRKFRVKTVKLAGQISQGLALPISMFPEIADSEIKEGLDLTERLKIEKYEKEEETFVEPKININSHILKFVLKYKVMRKLILPFISKSKRTFPSRIISESDETRIQCMPGILEKEKDSIFIATEKLEGCSATFTINRTCLFWTSVSVCSRKRNLPRSQNIWWNMYDDYCIQSYLKWIIALLGMNVKSVGIQGEIIGPKICKNIYSLKGHDLYIYRLKINYRNGNVKFLNHYEMQDLFESIRKEFGIYAKLKVVPVLWEGILKGFKDVNAILEFANGFSKLKQDQLREGLVFSKLRDPSVSFKAVSREYLIWKNKKEDEFNI